MTARKPRVLFFCRVEDRAILHRVEFYAQDIRALEELGYEVMLATHPRDVRSADLYYGWWWTWGFVPTLVGLACRRPVVLTGVFDEWAFGSRSLVQRGLHRFALAGASVNLFISRFEYETVPRSFHVRRPEYCPLTVDTDVYSPGGAAREPFLLCVAGSGMHRGNSKRKCIEETIRALAEVRRTWRHARLVLVGRKGSDHAWLDTVASDAGVADAVEFTGIISRDQKIDLYRRCALYLQPSRFEGFGLSILEAMACGAPVITSSVGAVPELVGDTAALVDGDDPSGIANAVARLWNSPGERARMGAAARQRAASNFAYARRRDFLGALLAGLLG